MPADFDQKRLRLLERLLRLPDARLDDAEGALTALAAPCSPAPAAKPDWPHAPVHRVREPGPYIVTAATFDKAHHFRGADRLDALETALRDALPDGGWDLEAWAVFSNHYHFVAQYHRDSTPLEELLQELHRKTALDVNGWDHTPGRQVWFQFWDTHLTYEASYHARLSYVHQNAVKHGLVRIAHHYRWCSAAWFERTATPAQVKTLYGMKIDGGDRRIGHRQAATEPLSAVFFGRLAAG